MKVGYVGREGQGKSLKLAQDVLELLDRNLRWYNKLASVSLVDVIEGKVEPPVRRRVFSNLRLSADVYAKYGGKKAIKYWDDFNEVIGIQGVDII